MQIMDWINGIIIVLFFLSYAYQFYYIPVALFRKPKHTRPTVAHRFAVLIAARNEEAVIGHLIDSLQQQNYTAYDKQLCDIYVVADNCTDATAEVCRRKGVHVLERFDGVHVGKGYALNWLLERIPTQAYDAFLVFDADNLLAPDYLTEMNKTFSDGYQIITSYRNSKNYGDNWISAGYALWFLREARYLNEARMVLGHSCAVSGTGFLFSRQVLEATRGWHFFLLTEDIEFSVDRVVAGEKIGYCPTAEFFDEQPTRFASSWRQRLRWSRGYLQVFRHYGRRLLRGIRKGSFSCYDMTMNIMPLAILSIVGVVSNTSSMVYRFAHNGNVAELAWAVLHMLCGLLLTMFILGAITTLSEWRRIHCPAWKKVLYAFTFPLFMLTYAPICVASFFTKASWKPIRHVRNVSLSQVVGRRP